MHQAISEKKHPINRGSLRVGENRLFLLFLVVSIILLFISGQTKLNLLTYPRTILLAPLNITLRFFSNIHDLKQENSRLALLATLLQVENASLKEVLRSKNAELTSAESHIIKSQIIGRDKETMGHYLLLDKGESSGIKINMPVITEQGIVGKVIQVSPFQSLIETMLSQDSKIAALDQRSRVNGVVTTFKYNWLKLNYVTPDADIKIDDTIISSGIGGVFTKGLLIGLVRKVDNRTRDLFKDISLQPFVNIYAIEAVYIINITAKPAEVPEAPSVGNPSTNADWEKTLRENKIEPPLEIKSQ
jgi:rod shape-determining protein MreC